MKKGNVKIVERDGGYHVVVQNFIDEITIGLSFWISEQDLKDMATIVLDEVLGEEIEPIYLPGEDPTVVKNNPISGITPQMMSQPLKEEESQEPEPLSCEELKRLGKCDGKCCEEEGGECISEHNLGRANGVIKDCKGLLFPCHQEKETEKKCCPCKGDYVSEFCRGECICHHETEKETPKKLPSERIDEITIEKIAVNLQDVLGGKNPIVQGAKIEAVIQYLDETVKDQPKLS